MDSWSCSYTFNQWFHVVVGGSSRCCLSVIAPLVRECRDDVRYPSCNSTQKEHLFHLNLRYHSILGRGISGVSNASSTGCSSLSALCHLQAAGCVPEGYFQDNHIRRL